MELPIENSLIVVANNYCKVLTKNSSSGIADNRFLVITDISNCSKMFALLFKDLRTGFVQAY